MDASGSAWVQFCLWHIMTVPPRVQAMCESALAVQLRHRLNDMGSAFPASSGLRDTLVQMALSQQQGLADVDLRSAPQP